MKLVKRNDGLFPSIWNTVNDDDWFGFPDTFKSGTVAPAVNIKENDENFEISLAAPGKKKEDFKIDLHNDVLTISSEEKTNHEEEDSDGKYTRREFNYSSFKRSFTLPESVEDENISAAYNDGVLQITIPKKEELKPKLPKTIQIS
jgi:HSP20 family protein